MNSSFVFKLLIILSKYSKDPQIYNYISTLFTLYHILTVQDEY